MSPFIYFAFVHDISLAAGISTILCHFLLDQLLLQLLQLLQLLPLLT